MSGAELTSGTMEPVHGDGTAPGDRPDSVPGDEDPALIEAGAFGARKIAETFDANGTPVSELFVTGDQKKTRLLKQGFADVFPMPPSGHPVTRKLHATHRRVSAFA